MKSSGDSGASGNLQTHAQSPCASAGAVGGSRAGCGGVEAVEAGLADLEARLMPLTDDDRPMRPFAQEALGLARLQFNKPAEAREQFVLLTLGQDVPDSVRQRAQAAISMIDAGLVAGLGPIVAAQQLVPPPEPALPTGPDGQPIDPRVLEAARQAQAQAEAQGSNGP